MSVHADLTGTDIHVPFAYTYANSTARLAATGFVAADVGKFAKQTDTNSIYMLTAITPTWRFIGGESDGTPTIAANSGAGTGATIAIEGTDRGGKITLTSGTTTIQGGVMFTVTYANAFGTASYPVMTPANDNAADPVSPITPYFLTGSTTGFTATIHSNYQMDESTQFVWNYGVTGK